MGIKKEEFGEDPVQDLSKKWRCEWEDKQWCEGLLGIEECNDEFRGAHLG